MLQNCGSRLSCEAVQWFGAYKSGYGPVRVVLKPEGGNNGDSGNGENCCRKEMKGLLTIRVQLATGFTGSQKNVQRCE
jgi:hypothetical protein